jgi:hypothetical protein
MAAAAGRQHLMRNGSISRAAEAARQRHGAAMVADNGGGQRQRTTTACEIGQRTTTRKVGSGLQTMRALSVRDGEDDVVFNGLEQNTFLRIR